ncbi:efflux transporter outer membrane subunit [Acidovorax sp. D4N7]|uniref:Efflux transporter outer membrane subunit n=2 Tax=Comamonas endophytica TaxID=2949090 RepID=A0ABY6GEL7_9BURK|nr:MULTISPECIES: efflux transporter outer membrane subunit [unclassified Acidovorax]MCD2511724.1 efflux transporter outer membrane subunit [Acidovorax sp. D4N7]UYG53346.1 efflux transporter outer membrane subunit [Acidovorax sp. 5MLIR]
MANKNLRRLHGLACAAAVAAALTGCANFAPPHATPAGMVPAEVGLGGAPAQATPAALDAAQALAWVQSPGLREALALALSNNRDLRVAVANIERARAQYGVAQADLLPSVSANAQANRNRTAADLTNTGRSATNTQYTAQLAMTSYEIDFWGRVRNLNEAALQAFLQTGENQRNVQLTLMADVANAWLTLAADQARLSLAEQTLGARRQSFALTERMHELGSTSGLVLEQNRTTVDAARADVASFNSQVERDRNLLQLLVGGPLPASALPAPLQLTSTTPAAALLPLPVPLPSSVLLERPDVRAAEMQLRAANANIGAARAALFPTISLTASVGTGSNELSGLFGSGNGTWSFVPLVRLPIFDGGRNRANVAVAEASQQVALAQYEKAVQTAFRETADALADRAQWAERLDAQASLVASTRRTFELSDARFRSGVDNYLSVLDAQRSLYAAQQTQISLQLQEQINRVTLVKVLGGAAAVAAPAAPVSP